MSQLTISQIVCFIGENLDSVGVGVQVVKKTTLILGASLSDKNFTGALFEQGKTPQDEEQSEPENMTTSTGKRLVLA